MCEVKFKRSNGQIISLGQCEVKDSWSIIQKFMDDHNYKSYYQRVTLHNDHISIDVGSWSQFFYIYGDMEELNKYYCF